jgi:hypothetical protein
VFGHGRVFLRFGDLRVLHGRREAGNGRRLVRMPRRSGLHEDCRSDTVRRLVPAGMQRISVDQAMCHTTWGPKLEFERQQLQQQQSDKKRGTK